MIWNVSDVSKDKLWQLWQSGPQCVCKGTEAGFPREGKPLMCDEFTLKWRKMEEREQERKKRWFPEFRTSLSSVPAEDLCYQLSKLPEGSCCLGQLIIFAFPTAPVDSPPERPLLHHWQCLCCSFCFGFELPVFVWVLFPSLLLILFEAVDSEPSSCVFCILFYSQWCVTSEFLFACFLSSCFIFLVLFYVPCV